MRILQVIEFFTPKMGGSPQVVFQIATHLAQQGHEVTVCSSDYGIAEVAFPSLGFEQLLFPCRFARWNFYLTPDLIKWAWQNVRHFDVIHLHSVRTFQNAVIGAMARRFGIPYVLSPHGTLPLIAGRKAAKQTYDLLFGNRLLKQAGHLIAVSPAEVVQFRNAHLGSTQISTIYNGLDLTEFSNLPSRGEMRAKLGVLDNQKVVVFLGRIHKRKGVDHLISAINLLRSQEKEVLLIVVGPDDGELSKLQAMTYQMNVKDHVRFIGPLYGRQKLSMLQDSDVFALPAVHEIFGLAPFEALMCGTPVIVADDSGSGDLIRDANAGYLVPYGDVTTLSEAIYQALTDDEKSAQMVQRGQAFARQQLKWPVLIRQLEAVYQTQIASVNPSQRMVKS